MQNIHTSLQDRWQDVIIAIQNKTRNPIHYYRYYIGKLNDEFIPAHTVQVRPIQRKHHSIFDKKRYYLGKKFPHLYFTQREAECMAYVLQGLSNKAIGQRLRLSTRTVEFYLRNMRKKINCRNRIELCQVIRSTDFITAIND